MQILNARAFVMALAVGLLVAGPALAASAENGKNAFLAHGCWQCHGTMGQGSIVTSNGKRLAPNPLPWDTFSAFVRSTNGEMPPFREKILSDADLADIYAYLTAIPQPQDVSNIPLLKP
jgi:ubiquinol-cytochrome c reductase cytochrome c subunit